MNTYLSYLRANWKLQQIKTLTDRITAITNLPDEAVDKYLDPTDISRPVDGEDRSGTTTFQPTQTVPE
jgi:hypothetical protein